MSFLSSFFDFLLPVHDLWWTVFGKSATWLLAQFYGFFHGVPLLDQIGAYGLAIIALTALVRLLMFPLAQFQMQSQRKMMEEKKRIAPHEEELKKRIKPNHPKYQEELMKLYQEHGYNPLGGAAGCLPLLIQMPVLTALYWVFRDNATTHAYAAHFLFIPDLNTIALPHGLSLAGASWSLIPYLVFPLLAAVLQFASMRMAMAKQPPPSNEQERQMQQSSQMIQYFAPVSIGYFGLISPAGLALYWVVQNLIQMVQQYFVTGWGGLSAEPAGPTPPTPNPGRGGAGRGPNANQKRRSKKKR